MGKHEINIAIGTDHRGYTLKELIRAHVTETENYSISWSDVGTDTAERTDYPYFARSVVRMMCDGTALYGVLLCGTGVGMSIAANRYRGIRAALAWNETVAQQCKEDDNANILVLPADYLSPEKSYAMITIWLDAAFKQGIYQKRLDAIENDLA